MSARPLPASLPSALIWHADQLATTSHPGLPTGFAGLDAELPGGGWPPDGLIELIGARSGMGELSLLLPLLRTAPADGWCVWVAPPFTPYAPALQNAGVPLPRQLFINPTTPGEAQWAARQALQSGASTCVLLWCEHMDTPALRRLQLAAETTCTPLFLFRPASAARNASPASLRLQLRGLPDGSLEIELLKRRGPRATAPVRLDTARLPATAFERPAPADTALAPLHAVVRPAASPSRPQPLHASAGR